MDVNVILNSMEMCIKWLIPLMYRDHEKCNLGFENFTRICIIQINKWTTKTGRYSTVCSMERTISIYTYIHITFCFYYLGNLRRTYLIKWCILYKRVYPVIVGLFTWIYPMQKVFFPSLLFCAFSVFEEVPIHVMCVHMCVCLRGDLFHVTHMSVQTADIPFYYST